MTAVDVLLIQALAAALAVGGAIFLFMKLSLQSVRIRLPVFKKRPVRPRRWLRLTAHAPHPFYHFFNRRRRRKIAVQIPDALDALVSALRAGYSLPAALAIVARETRAPVSEVFDALARADEYRLPLKDAVALIRPQLRLPEWDFVAEALRIHESIGGNFIPVIAQVAATVRDKQRVEAEVATATASGRFSGIVVAALAPLSFAAFSILSPSYMSILFTSAAGQMLLAAALLLELLGFFFIWRIVTIDY